MPQQPSGSLGGMPADVRHPLSANALLKARLLALGTFFGIGALLATLLLPWWASTSERSTAIHHPRGLNFDEFDRSWTNVFHPYFSDYPYVIVFGIGCGVILSGVSWLLARRRGVWAEVTSWLALISYVPSLWVIMDGVSHGYPRVVGRDRGDCIAEGVDFGPTVTVALVAVAMTLIQVACALPPAGRMVEKDEADEGQGGAERG
jgi:hypothetical protein